MTDDVEAPEKKECLLCGKALAIVGLAFAGIFLYISLDILTDGKLTSALGLGGRLDETEGA